MQLKGEVLGQNTSKCSTFLGGWRRYYLTKKHCAHLGARIELANRLLMPGRGRWGCIPSDLIIEDQVMNPDCFEIEWDEEGMELDDDGTLHARPRITVDALRQKHTKAQ